MLPSTKWVKDDVEAEVCFDVEGRTVYIVWRRCCGRIDPRLQWFTTETVSLVDAPELMSLMSDQGVFRLEEVHALFEGVDLADIAPTGAVWANG